MPKFLIEVPHENKKQACEQAIRVFRETGSHFLTNADWGCRDDVHKAWIIVEVNTKREALFIVPPPFRQKAQVITLNKFAFKNVAEATSQHRA